MDGLVGRREFIGAVSTAALGAVSYSPLPLDARELFDIAVVQQRMHQQCIDVLVEDLGFKNVSSVKYNNIVLPIWGQTYCSSFGKQEKSRIEVYPMNFGNILIALGEVVIRISPELEILESTLIHENQHADDNFNGWEFGNNLFDSELGGFIYQVRAYLAEFRRTSELRKAGKAQGAHLLNSYNLRNEVGLALGAIKSKKLTDFEKKLFEEYREKVRDVKEEVIDTLSSVAGRIIKMEL